MTKKTGVVIVCDWFDPAVRAGGPVQSLVNLIDLLHADYDFRIICGNLDYGTEEPLLENTGVWTDWHGKAQVMYLDGKTLSRNRIFDLLDAHVSEEVVLYIQGIFSLYFSIYPILWWHRSKHQKMVVAPRGMLHRTARSVKPFKKKVFLTLAGIFGWFNNIDWQSTQPDETEEIRAVMGKNAKILEAANIPAGIPPYKPEELEKSPLKIISVGRISDEKAPLTLLQVLARMDFPVQITLIGDYSDEAYFKSFQQALSQLPEHIKVTHILSVPPKKMAEYYQQHHVFVSCSKGENFGHAIAEALAHGLPCFIGENTPWKGLKSKNAGAELSLESDVFAAALEAYRKLSYEEKAEMSRAAHNFAVQSFQPEKYHTQYKALFSMEEPDYE
ncbi:MAG: glycosyltransferase family 4 protein [Sphingomonadales bacterium]|nr:glycosyltransferase family 4 protein [Sphingomonadales bacterium]